MDHQQGPTVQHRELCSMLRGSLDGTGVWGRVSTHIGEGNGTPLQYSCLENPMDGGALEGCSPWGRWGSNTTERLPFHFSLSCTGEGNGNPLQYSCLENPRMGEPGGLPSMGSHRVGHDLSDLAAAAAGYTYMHGWVPCLFSWDYHSAVNQLYTNTK